MRGLQNQQKAQFITQNPLDFPQLPPIETPIDINGLQWIDIDTAITTHKGNGLHFYIDDYKFERLWNNPDKYIELLKGYKHIIQPDFSLYYDFPVALQIYNKYRNHWLSAYYATKGITMIPNISLSTPSEYIWTLLGYPRHSVVAFSDLGAIHSKQERDITIKAYDEMIKRLDPIQILYFTRSKTAAPSEATVINLPFYKGADLIG